MRKRIGLIALLVGFGVACVLLLSGAGPTWAGPGSGGPFIVNSLLDTTDVVPGDGLCETAVAGQCTLRAAMREANAEPGVDTIVITATGTITITDGLPDIPESLYIFGPGPDVLRVAAVYTQNSLFGFTFDMVSTQPSDNIYFISGLELRGAFGDVGVNNGTLTLDNFRLAQASGLTIFGAGTQVTVRHSEFISNTHRQSALWLEEASLLVTDSLFQGNMGLLGGALNIDSRALIRNTAIISNASYNEFDYDGVGGGILVGSGGRLSVINSTISGNHPVTTTTYGGSGIYNGGVLTLTNVTLSNNTAPVGLGGGLRAVGDSVTLLRNTIIANSPQGGDCVNPGATVIDGGYNLIEDNGCGFTGGADPMLGPLANNGGPTPTHALLAGSPAIDAGNPAGCADPFGLQLVFDQRGYQRTVDGDANPGARCDIGAFEYLSSVLNLPLRFYLPQMSTH